VRQEKRDKKLTFCLSNESEGEANKERPFELASKGQATRVKKKKKKKAGFKGSDKKSN
jgi:hypothetical protein